MRAMPVNSIVTYIDTGFTTLSRNKQRSSIQRHPCDPLVRNKIFKLLAVFVILATANASATIILFTHTPEGWFIAADSREGAPGLGFDDCACKIVKLDPHTFFFAWGPKTAGKNPVTEKRAFAAEDISRNAFVESGGEGKHKIASTAAIWADMMIQDFKTYKIFSDGTMAQGAFAGEFLGQPFIYIVTIRGFPDLAPRFTVEWEDMSLRTGIASEGDPTARGFAAEFIDNKSQRAKDKSKELGRTENTATPDLLKMAILAVMDWIPDKTIIGGDIDVLEVPDNGPAKWLHVKKECDDKR
jgi:hypothetical protein